MKHYVASRCCTGDRQSARASTSIGKEAEEQRSVSGQILQSQAPMCLGELQQDTPELNCRSNVITKMWRLRQISQEKSEIKWCFGSKRQSKGRVEYFMWFRLKHYIPIWSHSSSSSLLWPSSPLFRSLTIVSMSFMISGTNNSSLSFQWIWVTYSLYSIYNCSIIFWMLSPECSLWCGQHASEVSTPACVAHRCTSHILYKVWGKGFWNDFH